MYSNLFFLRVDVQNLINLIKHVNSILLVSCERATKQTFKGCHIRLPKSLRNIFKPISGEKRHAF